MGWSLRDIPKTLVDDCQSVDVQWVVLSDLSYQLQRRCRNCRKPIPDFAPLNKSYCQAKCRANVWSRANRQFASAITVADFENVRQHILQFEARVNTKVIGYALVKGHPTPSVERKVGESTFPPKGRKTKRSPDATGRVRFSSTPFFSFAPWFEEPRVPVVGHFRLKVWYEGIAEPVLTGQVVEVRKAFPSLHFYDEKTGLRYTLQGEVIPPKPPKPPKPPTERKKRKKRETDTATAPQPERVPERASDQVPERAPERAPDAGLLSRVQSLEARLERQDRERAELLASLEKERREHAATRLKLEQQQKLRVASVVPRAPTRDDSSARLTAADQHNRALEEKLKQVEKSVQQLQALATEQDQKVTKLSKERDELTTERDELTKTVATLSSERAKLAEGILKVEGERKEQATTAAQAERDRSDLAAKLSTVERERDDLAAKLAHQAAPAATADAASENEGTDSTPPSTPTGIVIPRLALGGNLPAVSSPKTGPPSLGVLGQSHRPPIRGSANKKHKRR